MISVITIKTIIIATSVIEYFNEKVDRTIKIFYVFFTLSVDKRLVSGLTLQILLLLIVLFTFLYFGKL